MGAEQIAPLGVDQIIGERIHTAMWRARITQSQLADALGVDRAAVSRRLRGSTPWKVSDVLIAAQLCGVTLEDLMPTHEELGHVHALTRGNVAAQSKCTQARADSSPWAWAAHPWSKGETVAVIGAAAAHGLSDTLFADSLFADAS